MVHAWFTCYAHVHTARQLSDRMHYKLIPHTTKPVSKNECAVCVRAEISSDFRTKTAHTNTHTRWWRPQKSARLEWKAIPSEQKWIQFECIQRIFIHHERFSSMLWIFEVRLLHNQDTLLVSLHASSAFVGWLLKILSRCGCRCRCICCYYCCCCWWCWWCCRCFPNPLYSHLDPFDYALPQDGTNFNRD